MRILVRLDWRRVLVYTHRWLGIAGGLLFITWFVSGIVMMYARMPRLDPREQRSRATALDLSRASVRPIDARQTVADPVDSVQVVMVSGRPAYRFVSDGRLQTIFADDGRAFSGLSSEEALNEARRFAPEHASTARYDAYLLNPDQWTLETRRLLPMHRVALGDAEGSSVYVSQQTGGIVLKTTALERAWAYPGAVVHWLYFTPLRRHTRLWAQSIIWLSVAGSVLCLTGLVWGIWRYSPRRRYRLKRVTAHSPYAEWMRWHHYAGLLFGLTTLTWVFSGLLSMDPWHWHPTTSPTRAQRQAMADGLLRLESVSLDDLRRVVRIFPDPPKQLEIVQFRGELFAADGRATVSLATPQRGILSAFSHGDLVAAARRAMPGVAVHGTDWLQTYDAYYYDRRGELALPVLRVRFGDPQRTFLYVDPQRGEIVRKEERLTRLNRWLYHGLHSLDFPFLYYRRPWWDVVVIVFSLGGIALSVTTIAPAWRRIRRHARRYRRGWAELAMGPSMAGRAISRVRPHTRT